MTTNFLSSFNKTSVLMFPLLMLCISTPLRAESPPSYELRDLDGDTRTVEAIYDSANHLTWLTDTNLGKTQTFGIETGDLNDYYLQRITNEGLMTQDTAAVYIDLMNANQYLGYNQWRLPQYAGPPDIGCSEQFNNGQVVFGSGCLGLEVGPFNRDIFTNGSVDQTVLANLDDTSRWVGSIGPSGGLYHFQFGEVSYLDFCPGGTGICTSGKVWPVHDGSIGNTVQLMCTDYDGDGWGWTGYGSCRTAPITAGPCVDTVPVNDGWGWNGIESCTLPTEGEGFCQHYGDYPWGWNNATNESCRLD